MQCRPYEGPEALKICELKPLPSCQGCRCELLKMPLHLSRASTRACRWAVAGWQLAERRARTRHLGPQETIVTVLRIVANNVAPLALKAGIDNGSGFQECL